MILNEWNTEDAIAFAREEGREEGLEEGTLKIACNLLAEGIKPEIIIKSTGLSAEELEKLSALAIFKNSEPRTIVRRFGLVSEEAFGENC